MAELPLGQMFSRRDNQQFFPMPVFKALGSKPAALEFPS
jgi:hypothetical protein